MFQRQVAQESQSLKVTAEEPPERGAPGSPAVISCVAIPFCPTAWWRGQPWEHSLPLPLPDTPCPFPTLGQ